MGTAVERELTHGLHVLIQLPGALAVMVATLSKLQPGGRFENSMVEILWLLLHTYSVNYGSRLHYDD